MTRAFIRFSDGSISTDADESTLLRALRDPKAIFWVDLDRPDDNELAILDDVFGFHPLAIEDTIQYNQRPKIESYNHVGSTCNSGYFYMVIHGPDLSSFKESLRTKELDIFVSERYMVTIHEEEMTSVKSALMRMESSPARLLDSGVDMLLYYILDHVVDNYSPIFDWMQEEIDDLEDAALTRPTQELLVKIGLKKRELLNLRRIIGPEREVLAQLTRGDVAFIRPQARVYLRDVQDHLNRAVESIEIYRDLILGARDIYLSSISNQLNQIMKTLTIISVIALPMTVITSFFGMNFSDGVPAFDRMLHSTVSFVIAMVIMLGLAGGLLYLFKAKKWI
ncbi:MAG: magnesium/cobalt transporter CorA [Burkholderiales bacterium]|nr:magnesium/cobalt transporter CorA [Phycisphaerae bacterium]